MNYVLMTDSDSDMPLSIQQELNIPYVSMPYTLDGVEYFDDLGKTVSSAEFFQKMKDGAKASTAGLNEEAYLEYFEPILKEKDLLFIAFSSKMSSTFTAMFAAREKLLKKYPERKFIVVDTLSISAPMTLLVIKAHELYRQGKPMEEVAQWVLDTRMRARAYVAVDSLEYLRRGGRISGAAATVGTLLDLKPIIVENREGLMESVDKVRGRRRALAYIVDKTAENIVDPAESPAIVIHAAIPEEAERVRDMLAEKVPGLTIRIEDIGPVIGAHIGPGAVAIAFMGKERPA